jgi:heat shock protein HslJ/chitodextrinase
VADERTSRVVRGAIATFVIFGEVRDRTFKLRWRDVSRVESETGVPLEALSEPELAACLAGLQIPRYRPDDLDWDALQIVDAPDLRNEGESFTAAEPLVGGPWFVVLPIVAGGLVLLVLLFLVRSCAPGSGQLALTETPAVTTVTLTPAVGEATVTALQDAPVFAGPDEAYALIGVLLKGQSVSAVGQSADREWWAIRFATGPARTGWVRRGLVTAVNADGLPALPPPPLPSATPTPWPTASPTATTTATASPTPIPTPVAVIDGPTQARAGEVLRFDGRRSSSAPGRQLVAYEWDFGDGTTEAGIEVENAFDLPGNYDVLLIVTDSGDLTAQTVQQVSILAAPTPTAEPASAVISAPPQAGMGQPVVFDGSGSSAAAPIVQYRWTFGDGNANEGVRVEHTYNATGAYDITLVIVDETGQEATAATRIQIVNAPAPTGPVELGGSSWELTLYTNGTGGFVPALSTGESSALFGTDGALTGSGGCNDYRSVYQASGGVIRIGPPAAQSQVCGEPIGIMEQEAVFFRLLPLVTTYRFTATRLDLMGADGALLLQLTPLAQPN